MCGLGYARPQFSVSGSYIKACGLANKAEAECMAVGVGVAFQLLL